MNSVLGFVSDAAYVDGRSHVSVDARVEDRASLFNSAAYVSAVVSGSAVIRDSVVSGSALVTDEATLYDSGVEGSAVVSGKVLLEYTNVLGNARIFDSVSVHSSEIGGLSKVYGDAKLNNVHLSDNCHVFGNANLDTDGGEFTVVLEGDCKFGGNASFQGLIEPKGFVKKYGENRVDVLEGYIVLTDVWDMG